ncbi:MAG: hypothetical protein J0I12_30915 [Candidatus Eremiobacteraeota bacterium]|nr:hypothetical protein [Candidatus Eremiobacteraeota bacterium]
MIKSVPSGSSPSSAKKSPAAKAKSEGMSADQFAESHSALLQDTLGPLAKNIGARALSGKLSDAIREESRNNQQLAMLRDNLSEIADGRKGSIPLKEVYQLDQQMVKAAAEQATKTSAGVLDAESARFLPQELRADFEYLTGQTISDKPGVAVDGVTVKGSGKQVEINIEFEKALAGATAKDVVLALTDTMTVHASRLDGVEDPNIPPYWVVISPREGKVPSSTQINSGHGWSSFTNPDNGHLISPGHTDVRLHEDYNRETPFQIAGFHLDKVNAYGSPAKEPSAKTEAVRSAWDALCEAGGGEFRFEDGIQSGKLVEKTLAEVREIPGTKVLFSAIRENSGGSISRMVKDGLLEFALDKETNSLGVLRRVDGESEQWLSVVDVNKGRWVGTWSVSDDGTREWNER